MRIAILAAGLLGAAVAATSVQAQTAPAAPAAEAPAAGGFSDADLKAFGSAMACTICSMRGPESGIPA